MSVQHWTLDDPCDYCGSDSNTGHVSSCRNFGLYDTHGLPIPMLNALALSITTAVDRRTCKAAHPSNFTKSKEDTDDRNQDVPTPSPS